MVKMDEKGQLAYLALGEFKIGHRFVHNEQSKQELKCFQMGKKLKTVCLISIFELYIRKFSNCGFLTYSLKNIFIFELMPFSFS